MALSAAALRDAAVCDVTPSLEVHSITQGLQVIADRLHDAVVQMLITLTLAEDERLIDAPARVANGEMVAALVEHGHIASPTLHDALNVAADTANAQSNPPRRPPRGPSAISS